MPVSRSESALFAEQTYEMVGKGGKARRINRINKNIEKTGFTVDREHSGRDVVTYVNPNTQQVHVSHRGTDTSGKRTAQDLHSDFKIAIGQTKKDAHFKTRTKQTVAGLEAYPDFSATASAHSLGGKSITTSMATNKYVRDRITRADTFNSGATIFKEKEMQVLDKEARGELQNKMVHHRTKNDIVSASMVVNKPLGKVRTYKEKTDANPEQTRITSEGLGEALMMGNSMDILHSHKMDHFYNKKKYHDEE
jgi:hypothetical protein